MRVIVGEGFLFLVTKLSPYLRPLNASTNRSYQMSRVRHPFAHLWRKGGSRRVDVTDKFPFLATKLSAYTAGEAELMCRRKK